MLSYTELIKLPTFLDRYRYLKLNSVVAEPTFSFERYLNQVFYRSPEWRSIRRKVIIRDNGCDLGVNGYDVMGLIVVHHLNPITPYDIKNRSDKLMDLDNLICVSKETHNAIHYGDESLLIPTYLHERNPNDTCLWR